MINFTPATPAVIRVAYDGGVTTAQLESILRGTGGVSLVERLKWAKKVSLCQRTL